MNFDSRLKSVEIARGIVAEPAKGNGNVAVTGDGPKGFVDFYFCFLPSACGGRVEVRINGPLDARPEVSPLAGLTLTYEANRFRIFDFEQRLPDEQIISTFVLHAGANRFVGRYLGHPADSDDASPSEIAETACLALQEQVELLGDWVGPPDTAYFRKERDFYIREAAQDHAHRMSTTLASFSAGLTFSPNRLQEVWEWNYASYKTFAREHKTLSPQAVNFLFKRMREQRAGG